MSKVQAPDLPVTDRRRYGPFTRAVQRVGQARSFTVVVRYAGSKLDRVLYRASRGRITLSGRSLPMMLLTTRDRKTGEPRTGPVFYLRDGHNLVATYENFESAGGGSWPANLRADPRVTIQIGSTVTSYRARPATAEETDRTMQQLLYIWPAYDTYLQRSDTRQVIVFEPLHGSVHRPSAAGIEWLRPDVGGLDEGQAHASGY
jgi:deazaflavin-dependent oxidoreductase (nitroreductase family)